MQKEDEKLHVLHVVVEVLLYVHIGLLGLLGMGVQDGHLDFHTAPALWNLLLLFRPCFSFPEVSYDDWR